MTVRKGPGQAGADSGSWERDRRKQFGDNAGQARRQVRYLRGLATVGRGPWGGGGPLAASGRRSGASV